MENLTLNKSMLCLVLAVLILTAVPKSASAAAIYTEWTVNVVFQNGDVATGYFDESITGIVTSWHITLSGGGVDTPISYSTGGFQTQGQAGVCNGCGHDFANFAVGRYTDFATTSALPLTGGGIATIDGPHTVDCNNGPCNSFVSGSLTGVAMPEPASMMLVGAGLAGIGLLRRRRRVTRK